MKNLSYFLSFFILLSCSAYEPIQKIEPRDSDYSKESSFSRNDFRKLEKGDDIKITLDSGKEYEVTYLQLVGDTVKTKLLIDPATEKRVTSEIPYNVHLSRLVSVEKIKISWVFFGAGSAFIIAILVLSLNSMSFGGFSGGTL